MYICIRRFTRKIDRIMGNYIVSARKYRPLTFESVVGQKALTTTLKNAILSHKLAHAYLFCGPRGVGKTTCARIFAKTINCMSPASNGEACNECESCRAFNEQRSYNIHELDAASNNSIDDIRSLIEQVRIPPQIGKYKVYIIDEVHMLSSAAFNAFLKTLEEPPQHAIFILATTEKYKILPTILSRCQIYDFNRISISDIVEHLQYVAQQEGIHAEPEALNVIAQKADGGMRDALSIFDQTASFTGGNIQYKSVIENLNVLDYEYYFRLTDCLLENRVSDTLLIFNDILNKGFDGNHFITGLASHFRDLLVSKDKATLPLLEVGTSIRERYQQQSQRCPVKFLYKAMKLCNDCDLSYKTSKNKRLLVEITLIQLAQLAAPDADDTSGGRSPEQVINPIFKTSGMPEQKPQPASSSAASVSSQAGGRVASSAMPRTSPLPAQEKRKKMPVIRQEDFGILPRSVSESKPAYVPQKPLAEAKEENSAFSESELDFCWREFANKLPVEEKATSARMMNLKPCLLSETGFEVVVDNGFVEKIMKEVAPRVQAYMRQQLHNSHVTMSVRVSAPHENVKAYTRVERFQMMCKKNPELLKLKKEFGLEFY